MGGKGGVKLVAYYRVSTQKQGRSGLGLEAQRAAARQYEAAVGGRIVAEYVEVESGRKVSRVELDKAIRHARRSKATLAIAKLDRLARDVHFISGLMKGKVDFVACDKPDKDPFRLHVEASFAEEEARRISQRTKDALAARRARGLPLGAENEACRNLTVEARHKGTLAAAEARRVAAAAEYADLVPLLQELRAEGLSQRAIAARLNGEGHTTRSGSPWSQVAVKRVLDRASP